jgi:hypothetical protein
VAALANEVAGLVSALHGTDSDCGISLERRRLYRRGGPPSQRPVGFGRGMPRARGAFALRVGAGLGAGEEQ